MKSVPFEEYLAEWLQDSENVQAYFGVVIEEYGKDRDIRVFLRSLNNIASAKGGLLQLNKKTEVDQMKLDALLSISDNPIWDAVLEVLGYTLIPVSQKVVPAS